MTMPVVERESDEEEEWMSRVCYFVAEESVEQKEKGNKCEVCLYLLA